MGAKCYQFATKFLIEWARADLWGISPISFMYFWFVASSEVGIFNVAASWAGNYVAALSVPPHP